MIAQNKSEQTKAPSGAPGVQHPCTYSAPQEGAIVVIAPSRIHVCNVGQGIPCLPSPSLGRQSKEQKVEVEAAVGAGAHPPESLLTRGPTLIRSPELILLLRDYPDKKAALYLAEGFTLGFRILAPPPSGPIWAQNLRSMVGMEGVVCKNFFQVGCSWQGGWSFCILPLTQPSGVRIESGP